MKRRIVWIGAIVAAVVCRCSLSPNAGGGTTDTDNAKVAAVIHTSNGGRAAGVAVTVCPAGYLSEISADANMERSRQVTHMFTDDTGYFGIAAIDAGNWSIEVNDGSSSAVLLNVAVAAEAASALKLDATLQPYSTIEGNVGESADTTIARYLVVYGLERLIPVAHDGAFLLDNLPAGTFRCRVVAEAAAWAPLDLDSVTVDPAATVRILIGDTIDTIATDTPVVDSAVITLNTTASGADVAGDVHGFPALIRLTKDNFNFTGTESDGGNIRFVKQDGTPFTFAIELWDSLQGTASVWVQLDTISGNDTQSFLMLWGDSAGLPAAGSGKVFTTTGGFLGSYHLGGSLDDATGNGYNGVDSGTVNADNGIIGKARAFNGSTQFFTIGDLPDRENGTISFWLRPQQTVNTMTATTQGIWGKRDADNANFSISLGGTEFYTGVDGLNTYGKLVSKLENPDAGYYLVSAATPSFSAGVWYFAAWSWGGGGDSLYVNGTLESFTANSLTLIGNAAEEIGRCRYDSQNIAGGGPRYFNGTLDEFRIDNTCRSAAWVKLCYMNQRTDDRLVTVKMLE